MFLTALSLFQTASQHILQIPFFTLKEFPFLLEDKKSSKDDFFVVWKKESGCKQI